MGEISLKIGSGKTPKGGNAVYVSAGIPLLRSQNIHSDQVDFRDLVFITKDIDETMSNSRVEKNDVLLNITGASIGRSAVYSLNSPANVNQHVCIIRPSQNINSNFIQLNLTSEKGQKQIELNQAGGGREGLNFQQISKINFYFPSKKEQKQISIFFKQLDNILTLHQRKIELLKLLKQGYLQKMFPKKDEKVPRLRFADFRSTWEQRKLGECLSLLKDGTHGTHKDVKEGVYLLSAKNIKNGKINVDNFDRKISEDEYKSIHKNFVLTKGDVLLTIVGSIGEAAVIKNSDILTFQRSVAYLRPNEELLSQFLYTSVINTKFQQELKKRQVVSAQPGIYLGDLSVIPISITNIDEQQKIGNFFEKLDNLITLHQKKIDTISQLKQAYLQNMFI